MEAVLNVGKRGGSVGRDNVFSLASRPRPSAHASAPSARFVADLEFYEW